MTDRPPILFLVVDCLRADRAFAQASLRPDGFLGRLVARGCSFTSAIAPTPTTTPAVASMLTGRYPFEHGLRGLAGFARPTDVQTLAATLREAGYVTEADVTGPLGHELRLFDEFDHYRYNDSVDAPRASSHGRRGGLLADRVRELAREGRPWFLLHHLWDLHEPRQVPASFAGPALTRSVYDRALAALDDRLARLLPDELLEGVAVCLVGDHGENLRFEPRRKLGKGVAGLMWWRPTRNLVQPLARRVIAKGAHSSSKRALRLAPRAIITHGHHLFDPLLRVPYVVVADGYVGGSRSDALVTHVDLAPTLASVAGSWFMGGGHASVLPVTGDGDPERRVVLETAWVTSLPGVRQVGLRTRRWKYMELRGGGAPALFDLEADPNERRNVLREEPSIAAGLAEELHLLLAEERQPEAMSDEDAALVERRLRDLGYLA